MQLARYEMRGITPMAKRRNGPSQGAAGSAPIHSVPTEPGGSLSSRELEVLTWTARGKSAWETSEILSISKRTVDAYAHSAARKLGAVNRTHAVAIAMSDGLIDL
jgi:LuxR family quorum sensing-dependent transcriptional regulator